MEFIQSALYFLILGISGAIGCAVFVTTILAYTVLLMSSVWKSAWFLLRWSRRATSSTYAVCALCFLLGVCHHNIVFTANELRKVPYPALASASIEMADMSQYKYENVREVKLVPASIR